MVLSIGKYNLSDYLKTEYYQTIAPYISNKAVLDVGCVDHDLDVAAEQRLWNHFFIHSLAKESLGIDIQKEEVKKMQKMGYKVDVMDAEGITFKNKFDVIFAGELIEHLPNPGLFLKSAKKALKKNGIIIITTPNTFSVNRLFRVFQKLTNDPPANLDHTMYLTPQTTKTLAEKCGLKIVSIYYSFFPFHINSLLIELNKIACKILGKKFKEQLIIILK